jgi:hypothetical protein
VHLWDLENIQEIAQKLRAARCGPDQPTRSDGDRGCLVQEGDVVGTCPPTNARSTTSSPKPASWPGASQARP